MLSLRCQSDTSTTQKNEIKLDQNININLGVEATANKQKEEEAIEVDHCKKYIFQSRDEMSQSISKLCYGNLYVIGSLWLEGMKKIMVGKRMCVVPKAKAANNNKLTTHKEPEITTSEEECIPEKPPEMRYSELPLYCSPHQKYNEYMNNMGCCDCKSHRLQNILYPYVRETRTTIQCKLEEGREWILESLCVWRVVTDNAMCKVQEHMRDSSNKVQAKTCVALSTATGAVLGSKKGLLRAIFYGSLGALTSGALCFPKETDFAFRNTCYTIWSLIKKGFNIFEGTNNSQSEKKYLCPENMPLCFETEVTSGPKNGEDNKAREGEN